MAQKFIQVDPPVTVSLTATFPRILNVPATHLIHLSLWCIFFLQQFVLFEEMQLHMFVEKGQIINILQNF